MRAFAAGLGVVATAFVFNETCFVGAIADTCMAAGEAVFNETGVV
jgi:hypothetical protein